MSRWLLVRTVVLVFLFAGVLSGCDIAPNERLTGDPINSGGSGNDLDPNEDVNVAVYFYAGRPVSGLLYSCAVSGRAAITGVTDADGGVVCPRTATISFFVGVAQENNLKIGQVALDIFGASGDSDKRNFVAITPATLYGAATDGDRAEVTNIYNLLTSLDTFITRPFWHQPTIALTQDMSRALSDASAFGPLSMSASPSSFATQLAAIVAEVDADPDVTLVLKGDRPAQPVLSAAEAATLANESILRARTGLYRTSSFVYGSSGSNFYLVSSTVLVGNAGTTSGLTQSELFASTGQAIDLLTLDDAATVSADGTLGGFSFLSGSTGQVLEFAGSLINDGVYGEGRICNPGSPNSRIPSFYCTSLPLNDGFSAADFGTFSTTLSYSGDLYLNRVGETLPDIDLDLLPASYLPRTFSVTLGRYSDIQRAEYYSAAYSPVNADKTVFGAVTALPTALRYTIMANGDIVSDVDADCADVALVNGRYQDNDREEALIGRVGKIFTVMDKTYVGLQLAVLDPTHPYYGLNIGYAAIQRDIHPMVLRIEDATLLSKSCDPALGGCTDKIEWFNDVNFITNVYKPDVANGDDSVADALLYKDETYFGQVTGNAEVVGPTTICPALPPPPPP